MYRLIMSKEWNKEILSMLKDAGAVELPHGGGHLKFRLPNGRMFSTAKSPSDTRGVMNDLATLRRELRQTHPEIAMRGRSLSKEKMATYAMAVVNKPGDAPVPLTTYASLLPPRTPFQAHVSEVGSWPIGGNELFQASSLAPIPGRVDFFDPKTFPPPIRIEDSEMSSMLDRARKALDETKQRLASFNEQIVHLKIEQDRDIEKQLKLEEFINRQEAVAREATELLDFGVIPPEPIYPITETPPKERRRSATRMPLEMVHDVIFPALQSTTNGSGFSVDEFRSGLTTRGYGFDRKVVANWLGNEVRRPGTTLVRVSNGHYGFKSQPQPTSEEAMNA
jgi:hypothetical protein